MECRKVKGVIDETPGAYKPIDAVMAAQEGLVEIVHTLKRGVCVKGQSERAPICHPPSASAVNLKIVSGAAFSTGAMSRDRILRR